MSTFFQGQLDYIFFFYGLAFIGLGVVCYILAKEVNQRLPWIWLALFGLTHGANEWLDLVALCWGTRCGLRPCVGPLWPRLSSSWWNSAVSA